MEPSTERVQKHRDALRAAGLRPIQIWVPDTKRAEFIEECRKQSMLVRDHERSDVKLTGFMDSALEDVDGWEP
jgi:hypothetical protein